nr:unnamed protein product [Callosobruchus chinensis]
MANNPNKHVPKEDSVDSKSVERISSGESLYKTFTFAQSTNDEDTEKCIAFWRSVMEKNLQPIRCSIVENREYQPKDNVADEPYKGEKESDPKPKTVETKQEVNIEEQIDEKLKLVHKEYRDMWDRAIKQMQKQKLDKIKLVRRTRCKMCETLDARFDEDVCGDKATIDTEIKDLNKWKSTAKKKVYAAESSRGSRSPHEKPKQISNKLQKAQGIHPTGVKAGEDIPEEIQEALEEKPKKIKPPNTNCYEFVDAIQNKLQSGKYSEWRSNAVQETCTCGYKICCCNTNPAIKGIIPPSYLPSQTIPVINIDKTTKKTVTRASTDKKVPEKQPVRSALSVKSEDISTDRSNIKKELSILIPCGCSTQSCDCKENLQMLSRTKLPEEQWVIPPPPELHPLAQKRYLTSIPEVPT